MAAFLLARSKHNSEERNARRAQEETDHIIAQTRDIMSRFDANRDGAISHSELRALMQSMVPANASVELAETSLRGVATANAVSDADVDDVFKRSDGDNSGLLRSGEVRKAVQIWSDILTARFPPPPPPPPPEKKGSSLCVLL